MVTTTRWKGGSGDWQTAANWTNGAPTTPTSLAIINAPGTYTVTIGSGLEYHVGSVSLNDAGATLAIAGILDPRNRLTLDKGTLDLTGTIAGATIVAKGGTAEFSGAATLDDTTYWGTLDLGSSGTLTVTDGLTMHGTSGTGKGAIRLGGTGNLTFSGTQTINNGILTITGGKATVQRGTLTLGPAMTVNYKSQRNIFSQKSVLANEGLFTVAKGAVLSDVNAKNITSNDTTFTNSGRLVVNGGTVDLSDLTNTAAGHVTLYADSVFDCESNAGVLNANGATVTIRDGGSDAGTLNIRNSTVQVDNVSSLDTLNTITSMLTGQENSISIGLTLNNAGNTLYLDTPTGFKSFSYANSAITGGTVAGAAPISGTLTNVTVKGTLDVVGTLAAYGVSFTNTSGAGVGTVDLDGTFSAADGANKTYVGSLDKVTITAAAGSHFVGNTSNTFTLGSHFTLTANGNFSIDDFRRQTLVNEGTLEENGPGIFTVHGLYLKNQGTIEVNGGGTFVVATRGGLEIGGTFIIGANSTLKVNRGGTAVTTLDANVQLLGSGATFLSSGLQTIGADGSLSLSNGATLDVNPDFTIDGALNLSGSDFTATDIAIDSGGSLGGHGNVLGAVTNSGTIDASGGTLSISQGVTGRGQVTIENGAGLVLSSDVSAGQTVTFAGTTSTLGVGFAAGFDGTITGFAPGDTIDLINTKATGVTFNTANDTLTIKNKGALVAALQLSGDYAGDTFHLASDGKGGTDITVTAPSAALHQFVQAIAASSPSDMASLAASAPASLHGDPVQPLASSHA